VIISGIREVVVANQEVQLRKSLNYSQ